MKAFPVPGLGCRVEALNPRPQDSNVLRNQGVSDAPTLESTGTQNINESSNA